MRLLPPLLVVLAVAGTAAAQSRPPSIVFATDAEEDVRGPLDLKRVELARESDGKHLRATLTMDSRWTSAALAPAEGRPASVCLRLWTARDPLSAPPDYLVCAQPSGDALVGRLYRERANDVPRHVGEVELRRPTRRSVRLRFLRTAIKAPDAVEFSGETVWRGRRCPVPLGCVDLAPGSGQFRSLTLRTD